MKKAKEDLEQFLLDHERMTSTTKYYKCEEMYGNLEVWRSVGDSDRRDIFEDVIFNLAKREKEEAKQLKKRNTKRLAQVINHRLMNLKTVFRLLGLLPCVVLLYKHINK